MKLHETKLELNETKIKLDETTSKLKKAEARLEDRLSKLQTVGDFVKFQMPKFSKYHCTGKVWHSPPFYYKEGYKMCLAVYANGIGNGASTHVSIAILLLRGEYDYLLKWPMRTCYIHSDSSCDLHLPPKVNCKFFVCHQLQRPRANERRQIRCNERFCNPDLHLVNDCLTFNITYNVCYLKVWID